MLNFKIQSADTKNMQLAETFEIAKQVVLDKRVIIVTVVLLLYLSIVNYVIRYRKKPPKVRKAHLNLTSSSAAKKPADGETSATESAQDDNKKTQGNGAGKSSAAATAKPAPAPKKVSSK